MPKDKTTPAGKGKPRSIPAEPLKLEIDITKTEAAWARQEPRFRALSIALVNPASLDVTQAAAIAIVATENVLGQRARLEATFRNAPIAALEHVIEVAYAVQHADLLHRVAQDESSLFADIYPRMTELRGLLLDDLDIQVKRKRLKASVVSDMRAGDKSPRDFANDLNDAVAWYRVKWDDLPSTTVSAEELNEASRLATTALARVGAKIVVDAAKASDLSTSEMRQRAFSALEREYGPVQRYGAFLFWDMPGGWEQFTPSLWAGRASDASSSGGATVAQPPVQPAGPPTTVADPSTKPK